jgi:Arc/MetJ-type ribon-helix-helix transcriptional regulator
MLTVRLPVSLVEAVQQLADARGATVSELVRSALRAVVDLDPAVRRHATVLYEVAKTRCVLLRLLDTQMTPAQVDHLLALAESDATGYVREL